MGTNTGAMKAHLAEALPIRRFSKADSNRKEIIRGMGPSPEACKLSAPLMARIMPRFVYLK